MAIKYLKAEKQNTQYYFQVNLDDSKNDPTLVKEFSFPVFPPEGLTNEQYLAEIKSDLQVLLKYEFTKIDIAQATIPQTIPGFLD